MPVGWCYFISMLYYLILQVKYRHHLQEPTNNNFISCIKLHSVRLFNTYRALFQVITVVIFLFMQVLKLYKINLHKILHN